MPTERNSFKRKMHVIINEADTPMGKAFDVILLVFILLSVLVVMLDSVNSISTAYQMPFKVLEWIFTIFFTAEYILRVYITRKPWKNYIFTFYGVIDLLAVLPTYLSLVLSGVHFMMVIRAFRLIRVFRILKLARFIKATNFLKNSLVESRHKIAVFLEVVISVVIIMGSLMYIIEGPESGFTSIPRGIYWAIVTLTTVGYGDIAPTTILGQFVASAIMILGYSIIAVPTGIISSEMSKQRERNDKDVALNTQVCEHCHCKDHDDDACYCKRCGTSLKNESD